MIATRWALVCAVGAILSIAPRGAAYTPVVLPPMAVPAVGPGVIVPNNVFGKEYSRNLDENSLGVVDPERVVAWDGVGGTLDGLDYSGSRLLPAPREQQVDALANSFDMLYNETLADRSHLIFSHTSVIGRYGAGGFAGFGPVVPLTGPVTLTNGNVILGAAEISVEEGGVFAGPQVQHGWAPIGSITTQAPAADLDGLEVWGPEPALAADSNKYSLEYDVIAGGGVSVWSYDLGSGDSFSYITHATIVTAVTSLLGNVPTSAFNRGDLPSFEGINLDALMVQDRDGVGHQFGGIGDSIIFSISQIVDPADNDGYYATGSELFVLEATAAGLTASFLRHGGHIWDHNYALTNLGIAGLGAGEKAIIDINAIEAVGELVVSGVPEPGACLLLGLAAVVGGWCCRRRAT